MIDAAAHALRERIWKLLGAGDPEACSEAVRLATSLPSPSDSPDDLTAHCLFDIAFELERRGEDEQALAQYRRVIEYPVSNLKYPASAWFRIGVCLRRQGNYSQAVESYGKSLALADDLPHLEALAHFSLAELLEAAEEYHEAAASYGKAMEMLPHPDIRTPKAKLAYGRCCFRTGNDAIAMAILQQVASCPHEPESAEAWRWLAEIAEKRKEYEAAARAYREIISSPHAEPSLKAAAAYRIGEASAKSRRSGLA